MTGVVLGQMVGEQSVLGKRMQEMVDVLEPMLGFEQEQRASRSILQLGEAGLLGDEYTEDEEKTEAEQDAALLIRSKTFSSTAPEGHFEDSDEAWEELLNTLPDRNLAEILRAKRAAALQRAKGQRTVVRRSSSSSGKDAETATATSVVDLPRFNALYAFHDLVAGAPARTPVEITLRLRNPMVCKPKSVGGKQEVAGESSAGGGQSLAANAPAGGVCSPGLEPAAEPEPSVCSGAGMAPPEPRPAFLLEEPEPSEKRDPRPAAGAGDSSQCAPLLKLDGDFVFPQGSITILIGDTGCGKSTLLSVLMGTRKLDGGSFHIDAITSEEGEEDTVVEGARRSIFPVAADSSTIFATCSDERGSCDPVARDEEDDVALPHELENDPSRTILSTTRSIDWGTYPDSLRQQFRSARVGIVRQANKEVVSHGKGANSDSLLRVLLLGNASLEKRCASEGLEWAKAKNEEWAIPADGGLADRAERFLRDGADLGKGGKAFSDFRKVFPILADELETALTTWWSGINCCGNCGTCFWGVFCVWGGGSYFSRRVGR